MYDNLTDTGAFAGVFFLCACCTGLWGPTGEKLKSLRHPEPGHVPLYLRSQPPLAPHGEFPLPGDLIRGRSWLSLLCQAAISVVTCVHFTATVLCVCCFVVDVLQSVMIFVLYMLHLYL